MTGTMNAPLGPLVIVAITAAIVAIGLIVALRPLLVRYALARPNARSSHREPTPQGGGIAVIAAVFVGISGVAVFAPTFISDGMQLGLVLAATLALALVGATDDIHPLEAVPRLLLQTAAVAVVVAALPRELHVIPALPWWFERACLLIGGVWFVNLCNFMDGIDWMTVAEVVPVTGALSAFGLMGALPPDATLVAIALLGAILGFAPFNRPVARLFLGDVGSLPIGLLLTWLLILLAGRGHLAAALLLPLYYVADATITLLRRMVNGEQVLQAHRSHFYQRAVDRGTSVYRIVTHVFAVNLALAGLAAVSLWSPACWVQIAASIAGLILVGWLLLILNRKK